VLPHPVAAGLERCGFQREGLVPLPAGARCADYWLSAFPATSMRRPRGRQRHASP
jgi:hypothetical protein